MDIQSDSDVTNLDAAGQVADADVNAGDISTETPPAEEKYGIKETQEGLIFLMTLIHIGANYKSLSVSMIYQMITDVAPKALTAIKGADQIPKELGDLSPAEASTLLGVAAGNFDIDNNPGEDNPAEKLVKHCLAAMGEIADAIGEYKEYKKAGEQGAKPGA